MIPTHTHPPTLLSSSSHLPPHTFCLGASPTCHTCPYILTRRLLFIFLYSFSPFIITTFMSCPHSPLLCVFLSFLERFLCHVYHLVQLFLCYFIFSLLAIATFLSRLHSPLLYGFLSILLFFSDLFCVFHLRPGTPLPFALFFICYMCVFIHSHPLFPSYLFCTLFFITIFFYQFYMFFLAFIVIFTSSFTFLSVLLPVRLSLPPHVCSYIPDRLYLRIYFHIPILVLVHLS